MKTEKIIVDEDVAKRIAPTYFELQLETQDEFEKNQNKFFQKFSEKMETANVDIMRMSLPRRKRWLGILPISMELGFLQESSVVRIIVKLLSEDNCKISNLSRNIVRNSSQAREAINMAVNEMPESSTNLGNLDHTLFHHKFEMSGAPLFQITDQLAVQLHDTDIGKGTPCFFLKQPYPMMYIEFGSSPFQGIEIHNRQSGWHQFEGVYLNSIEYSNGEIDKDIELGRLDLDNESSEAKTNMLSHAYHSGHVKKDNGPVRIIEVLATGSPIGKESNFDDATVFFILVIQDEDMSVQDLINWHIKYYKGELSSQDGQDSSLRDLDINTLKTCVMGSEDLKSFPDIVDSITKSLLYINSETALTESIRERDDFQVKLKRTLNKAKKRKLNQQSKQAINFIRVGADISEGDSKGLHYGNNNGTKKTHWRRAHFREQAYGKGRSLRKIKWIPRSMINASSISGLDTKPYKVG